MKNEIWVGKGLEHLFNDDTYHCFKMSASVEKGYLSLGMLMFEHENNETMVQDIYPTNLEIDNLNEALRQCLTQFVADNFRCN